MAESEASASPGPDASADPSADCFRPPCNDVVAPGGGGGGKPPRPADVAPWDNMPDFQLFDRTTQRWVEFPHPTASRAYLITEPERYVDESGTVLFRFINRAQAGEFGEEQRSFQLVMRIEGVIG